MTKAFIAGSGTTAFGSFPDRTGRDMFAEAGLAALEDAGLASADVDEVFYGNFVGTLSERQGHQGPLVAKALGTTAPARRVESACASSGVPIRDVVEIGGSVTATVEPSEMTDDRTITFRPTDDTHN